MIPIIGVVCPFQTPVLPWAIQARQVFMGGFICFGGFVRPFRASGAREQPSMLGKGNSRQCSPRRALKFSTPFYPRVVFGSWRRCEMQITRSRRARQLPLQVAIAFIIIVNETARFFFSLLF